MKVILDTNVIVSGIFWKGASEKVLYAWADDKFKLVISSGIITEIIKTLMNFKIKLPFDDILLWLSVLLWKAELVEPEERVDVIKDDPDDNKFIEAAIEGNAGYIVSQDKHLLNIKEYKGIKIILRKDFLEVLKDNY